MIYLLYGTDTDKSRNKLHELVTSLITKKPDASHIKINDESFDEASFQEYISGMGLFSQKMIVEMDMVFQNKEAKKTILEQLKNIAASDNIFVVREQSLLKAELTKFEKYAEKIQVFDLDDAKNSPKQVKSKAFNIFSLTDALGKRDKKQLWVLYHQALMNNAAPEEIHGILFWHIKSMIQAVRSKNAQESGLNPFVYQKSLGFSKNFTPRELTLISSQLVSLYHDARRGIRDFENALETFILKI